MLPELIERMMPVDFLVHGINRGDIIGGHVP
jgi:hypothetical protein